MYYKLKKKKNNIENKLLNKLRWIYMAGWISATSIIYY